MLIDLGEKGNNKQNDGSNLNRRILSSICSPTGIRGKRPYPQHFLVFNSACASSFHMRVSRQKTTQKPISKIYGTY